MSDSIYLSGHDVLRIAHHAHWIPIGRGFTRQFMDQDFPGWTFNSIYPRLIGAGVLTRRPGEFSERHLPEGIIGVEIDRRGSVAVDDGSSRSAARLASWDRNGGERVSEHLAVSRPWSIERVIVHVPHAATHIPATERPSILLSDTALTRELRASTDQGTAAVARRLDRVADVTVAAATLSRLVFDPERFATGDPAESTGRGLVYTRTADGGRLRDEPDDSSMTWHREQHLRYTRSMEHLVRRAIDRHGRALIVDLHSYPFAPQAHEDPTADRPDVCIGTDPHHTPGRLVDAALTAFGSGFAVRLDTPYSGSYVPGAMHLSDAPVESIMIEVRRDVLRTSAGRDRVADAIGEIIEHH
jgi:N-formylglutamate deformylase